MAKQFKPETLCVQAGWTPKKGEPRVLPIYQSTTFKYDTSEQMARLFDLEDRRGARAAALPRAGTARHAEALRRGAAWSEDSITDELLELGEPSLENLADIAFLISGYTCAEPTFVVIDNYQLFDSPVRKRCIAAFSALPYNDKH